MTIRWTPDTCDCVVDLKHGTDEYVGWVQKCQGHKHLESQNLVDELSKLNKKFQMKHEDQKDKKKVRANMEEKRIEKEKNKKLGKPVKRFKQGNSFLGR